ncbi:hypothetical protein [Flavivirga jejuensis]|uniref:Uncharacterized protein n=1 Tax=Flavivirga jejuensis TaxID=870487 RepID=A0ABT8WQ37_9FLAO|nr:hypothetical protein [Flavivirga jejuensis]MDO5975288.1 hypothetical protein [Flavivirga jejuensis]
MDRIRIKVKTNNKNRYGTRYKRALAGNNDKSINIWGSFTATEISTSVDTDGNVQGPTIENGNFDGDFNLGKGKTVSLTAKDISTVGVTGKLGPAKASLSINFYNLASGLSKTVEGGVNYLAERASSILNWQPN